MLFTFIYQYIVLETETDTSHRILTDLIIITLNLGFNFQSCIKFKTLANYIFIAHINVDIAVISRNY